MVSGWSQCSKTAWRAVTDPCVSVLAHEIVTTRGGVGTVIVMRKTFPRQIKIVVDALLVAACNAGPSKDGTSEPSVYAGRAPAVWVVCPERAEPPFPFQLQESVGC